MRNNNMFPSSAWSQTNTHTAHTHNSSFYLNYVAIQTESRITTGAPQGVKQHRARGREGSGGKLTRRELECVNTHIHRGK